MKYSDNISEMLMGYYSRRIYQYNKDDFRFKFGFLPNFPHLFADSISAWSNQGSVMCLVSILNQEK